ncbi:uncharacterized protein LOC143252142 [Tachypleus tridentatus]|uniref:uncharacterized protein LOC143252142 n=1 Tax=Tachypleus tridentatus TaxID=6853 RepID=UPI003FD0CBD4
MAEQFFNEGRLLRREMMFIVAIILVHLAGKGLSEESNRWKPITSTNDQRPMSSRFYYVVLPKSLLYGQSFDILNTQSDRKFKGQLQTVDQQENNHEIQQQHQDLSYNQHQQKQALQFNPQQRYNDQIDSSVSQHQKGFDTQVQEQQHRGYEGQHQQPQEIRFHNEQQLNYGNEGEQQQKEFTLQNQQQQNNGYEGQQQQQENGFQNQQQQTHGYEGQEKQQQQEIRFQKQQRQEQLGNQGQRQFGYQAKKTTDVLDNRHNNGGYHIKVGKYTANVHPQSRAPQPVDQLTFFRTPEQPNKVEIAPLKPPELPKVDRPNIPLFQAERPSVIPPVPGQLVNQQPLISFQSVDKRLPSVTSATFRPPVIPPIPDRSVIPPVPVQLTTKRPLVEFPPQFPGRQVVIPPRPKDISQGFCTCKSSCSPQSNIPSNIGTLSFQQAAASLEADAVLSLIRLDEESIIALLSAEGPYTLFLPSNNALSRLPPQLLKIWKEDSDTFTKIFLNHIIPTKLSLEDLRQTPTIDPRAANVDTLYVNSNEDETVTINGQRIVTTNAPGPKGGMIHVIDGVLYPLADKDIVDTVIQCNKFSGFLTLLEGTQLIDTLRRDGPFTLFLPSDDALSKIPENELDVLKRNITALRAFLLYHMVEGVHYGADLRDAQYLTSLYQSQPVRVSVNVDGCRRRLYEANNSPLYRADIPARNGVIHVVDWVLKLEDLETCDGVILP